MQSPGLFLSATVAEVPRHDRTTSGHDSPLDRTSRCCFDRLGAKQQGLTMYLSINPPEPVSHSAHRELDSKSSPNHFCVPIPLLCRLAGSPFFYWLLSGIYTTALFDTILHHESILRTALPRPPKNGAQEREMDDLLTISIESRSIRERSMIHGQGRDV